MAAGDNDNYYRRHLRQFKYRYPVNYPRHSRVYPIMSSKTRVSEFQGMDGSRIKNFPFSSFKLLGGLQIGIGATCLVLGIVDLFLFLYVSDEFDDETLSALTIATVPVWCGLWFIVSGAMGSCMSLDQKSTLSYFKNTFLVLSVLCCILFAPCLCAVEIYIVVLRTDNSTAVFEWLIPLLIAFFAFNEIICAVITAGICCCCSPLQQAKVRILYARHVDEYDEPMEEKRRLKTPEIFYTESARMERSQRAPVHHARRHYDNYDHDTDDEHWEGARSNRSTRKQPRAVMAAPETPTLNYQSRPAIEAKQPRAVMTADSPTTIHYSRPPTNGDDTYHRFKMLAIPGNSSRA